VGENARSGKVRAGLDRRGGDWTGLERLEGIGQDWNGRDRNGLDRIGRDRSGRIGGERIGQEWIGKHWNEQPG
jgi:hypothetical protein